MKKSVTLLDGGMGQELIRRSGKPPTPLWSVRIMLDNPELVETLHMDFIAAGAKVIALNNYVATPARLARDASVDLFEPIHQSALSIAKSARKRAGISGVQIAGCLPPLIASYQPDLAPNEESCLAQYRELVAVQKDGIDLMMCETIPTIREAVTAATAARDVGLRTVMSFTLDDDNPNCLRSGESLNDAVKAVAALDVEAVTVNCSMPETVTAAMPGLAAAFPNVGGYANGFQSVEPLEAGGTVSSLKARRDLPPKVYAQYAMEWINAGAKVLGGCCEVGPDHIAELNRVLRAEGYEVTGF